MQAWKGAQEVTSIITEAEALRQEYISACSWESKKEEPLVEQEGDGLILQHPAFDNYGCSPANASQN